MYKIAKIGKFKKKHRSRKCFLRGSMRIWKVRHTLGYIYSGPDTV